MDFIHSMHGRKIGKLNETCKSIENMLRTDVTVTVVTHSGISEIEDLLNKTFKDYVIKQITSYVYDFIPTKKK